MLMHDSPANLAWLLEHVIDGSQARPDAPTTVAILEQAARFADQHIAVLAATADAQGCRLHAGRVLAPPGYAAAWHAYAKAGWTGLTAPDSAGGQNLPMALATAVQEIFDAADPAFGMLAVNTRCATRLLQQHGNDELCAAWLPQLTCGNWGATICISEPHAGSDIGRIRTRAVEHDGVWRVTGDKSWISFGDHDLTERIGHFALVRRAGAPSGTRGLSLFLIADTRDDGSRNGVTTLRIEEKLGLHGSPTCAMRFEDAVATPIGQAGRGLPTLFAMIVAMRLAVATQGAAVAQAAASVAQRYAAERTQGGDAESPPIPINRHAEVRHLLLAMRVRAEAARLLALQTAAWVDAGDAGDHAAAARAAMLLPVAKTCNADAAFANADDAIQILAGAGYVKDWPIERMLRDARVFSIYEGTTAIQGLDLLLRRVLAEGGAGVLHDLLDHLAPHPPLARSVLDTAAALSTAPARSREAAAVPFLRLLGMASANGLLRRAGRAGTALGAPYAGLSEYHTSVCTDQAVVLVEQCLLGSLDRVYERVFC